MRTLHLRTLFAGDPLTRTFQYLGSLISYNLLLDKEDIKARIAAAYASMGALKKYGAIPTSTPTTSTYCSEQYP